MSQNTATFNASADTLSRRSFSFAEFFNFLGQKFLLCLRFGGVFSLGCFVLASLFVLQIAALEIGNRLDIFPLYGFFFINFICGLFLTGFIYVSRKFSSRIYEDTILSASASPNILSKFRSGLSGVLDIQEKRSPAERGKKPVAVLLIIKRRANEKAVSKGRATSA